MAVACTWGSGTITAGRVGQAACTDIVTPTLYDTLALHNIADPDGNLLAWTFVNGQPAAPLSTTPGLRTAGRAFAIPASAVAGSYIVRLYSGLHAVLLAESAAFTINAYDNVIVLTGPGSQSVNTTLTATFSGIPASLAATGNLRVGLFNAIGDEYTIPLVTASLGLATSGTAPLYIPNDTLTGNYRLRIYYAGDQYPQWYVESANITITAASAVSIASPGAQLAGTQVLATWANIVSPAPSVQDWVGLFALGAPRSAPLGWRFLDGSASGSLPFVIPAFLPTASYELRLYSGGDQSLLATSATFTVTAAP